MPVIREFNVHTCAACGARYKVRSRKHPWAERYCTLGCAQRNAPRGFTEIESLELLSQAVSTMVVKGHLDGLQVPKVNMAILREIETHQMRMGILHARKLEKERGRSAKGLTGFYGSGHGK